MKTLAENRRGPGDAGVVLTAKERTAAEVMLTRLASDDVEPLEGADLSARFGAGKVLSEDHAEEIIDLVAHPSSRSKSGALKMSTRVTRCRKRAEVNS